MNYDELEQQLRTWLGAFSRRILAKDAFRFEHTEQGGRVRLATATHQYVISFHPTSDYLGCIADSRIVRAGETWTRGNDLADGKFNEETFKRIVTDILAYELVPLATEEPSADTPPQGIATVQGSAR